MARVKFAASSKEFDPLAVGSYICKIESMEVKQSSKGNPMIAATYTVQSDNPDYHNRKLFDNLSLLVEAGWKLKNLLEASQTPHAAMPTGEKGAFDIDFDTADAIGKQFIARLGQETYQTRKVDANGAPVMGIRNTVEEYLKV